LSKKWDGKKHVDKKIRRNGRNHALRLSKERVEEKKKRDRRREETAATIYEGGNSSQKSTKAWEKTIGHEAKSTGVHDDSWVPEVNKSNLSRGGTSRTGERSPGKTRGRLDQNRKKKRGESKHLHGSRTPRVASIIFFAGVGPGKADEKKSENRKSCSSSARMARRGDPSPKVSRTGSPPITEKILDIRSLAPVRKRGIQR